MLIQRMVETLDFDNLALNESSPTPLNLNVLAIFSKPRVLACSKISNKPNVRSMGKKFDSENERVMIGVLASHVSLEDADASKIQNP